MNVVKEIQHALECNKQLEKDRDALRAELAKANERIAELEAAMQSVRSLYLMSLKTSEDHEIVRQIDAALEPKPSGVFRDAKGILPWKEGDELPEDAIRRLRDGEE